MTRQNRKILVLQAITVLIAMLLLLVPSVSWGGGKKIKLRVNNYYYSAFNRRDPFASLIVGDFVKNKKMSPVDLNNVELVGVVKGDMDRFALLEDENGYSYILRVGSEVRNGRVVAIGEKSLVARVTNFGQTTKYTLHLSQRKEGDRK
jgi:hypothetical protein